jgi:hypothetical protein
MIRGKDKHNLKCVFWLPDAKDDQLAGCCLCPLLFLQLRLDVRVESHTTYCYNSSNASLGRDLVACRQTQVTISPDAGRVYEPSTIDN